MIMIRSDYHVNFTKSRMQVASHPLLTEQELLLVQKETERILGYNFRTSSLLIEALTTPGSEGEDFQGHRWLGDFGIDVIRSCVTLDGYQKKAKPSKSMRGFSKACNSPTDARCYGQYKTADMQLSSSQSRG